MYAKKLQIAYIIVLCLLFFLIAHNWDHIIVKSRLIFANGEREMRTSGELKKLVNDSELYNKIPNRKSSYTNKFPYTVIQFNCLQCELF